MELARSWAALHAANASHMTTPAEPKPPEVAAQSSGEGELDIETVSAMPRRRAARVSAELSHSSANMHHEPTVACTALRVALGSH